MIKNTRFMRRLMCYWTLEERMWRTWVKIPLLSGTCFSEMIELPTLSTRWHIPKCAHEATGEFEETRSYSRRLSLGVIFSARTQQQISTKLKQVGISNPFQICGMYDFPNITINQNEGVSPNNGFSVAWSKQICSMYPTQKKHGISPIDSIDQ